MVSVEPQLNVLVLTHVLESVHWPFKAGSSASEQCFNECGL